VLSGVGDRDQGLNIAHRRGNIMLHDFTKTTLLIVASLLPLINPPASALIATGLVPHLTPPQRTEMAVRVTVNCLVILLVSLLIGAYVLSFFGISMPVLRVGGGAIVAMAGWKLLHASDDEQNNANAAPLQHSALTLRTKAFYPITLPITVGPGSIAVAIALGTQSPCEGLSVAHVAGVSLALAILGLSIYLCMRFAGHIERLLGAVGTRVAMRLFAFVLFCIGLQILWKGLAQLLDTVRFT
jgi:multiple antibiotic resistance protein